MTARRRRCRAVESERTMTKVTDRSLKLSRRKSRRRLGCLILGGVVLLSGVSATAVYVWRRWNSIDSRKITLIAQTMVRQKLEADLGEGVQMHFAPPEFTHIEPLAEDKFYVAGWFEAFDSTGTATSFTYSCILISKPDGDWVAERVDVLSQ